ncbi:MAG TPA: G1 family glutamic endopeptidase [Phycicoccus sp.]|nr:G1 family glutamic endopeptidase [Phycicoccus sp.]
MTAKTRSTVPRLRPLPPPPADFDPFTAGARTFARHGVPPRPDPVKDPGLAALWDTTARRFSGYEHLAPEVDATTAGRPPTTLGIGPSEFQSSGFSLASTGAPFTALFVHWTVPNLVYVPTPSGRNLFHTFVGLGFLDVHVQMSVTSAQKVTAAVSASAVGDVSLPVAPGDAMSAAICLDPNPPGRANYVIANETRGQTMNFSVDTHFPPAVTVDAGVTRDLVDNNPTASPLARFGVVYFDEISAYTTAGPRSLTGGSAITMTDLNGSVLARPVRITDYTFKVLRA